MAEHTDKARALLLTLDEQTRNEVLSRLGEEQRAALLAESPGAASLSIAEKRRLMRETMLSVQDRAVEEAQRLATGAGAQTSVAAGATSALSRDPFDRLRGVHPAAIAAAMRGERPQAWALVLEKLEARSRELLLATLEPAARMAIAQAGQRLSTLAPNLRSTAERAIVHTVVPRALQEQRRLMTTPMTVHGFQAPR